jgi:hypothetical protein
MKKLFVFVGCIAVLVSLLFGGGVIPLGTGATVHGMRSVAQGAPGTFVLVKDQLVVLAWPVKSSYAFAVLNASSAQPVHDFLKVACNGQCVGTPTFTTFVNDLIRLYGFKEIAHTAIPTAITARLLGWQSWISRMNFGQITILVLPLALHTNLPEGITVEKWSE